MNIRDRIIADTEHAVQSILSDLQHSDPSLLKALKRGVNHAEFEQVESLLKQVARRDHSTSHLYSDHLRNSVSSEHTKEHSTLKQAYVASLEKAQRLIQASPHLEVSSSSLLTFQSPTTTQLENTYYVNPKPQNVHTVVRKLTRMIAQHHQEGSISLSASIDHPSHPNLLNADRIIVRTGSGPANQMVHKWFHRVSRHLNPSIPLFTNPLYDGVGIAPRVESTHFDQLAHQHARSVQYLDFMAYHIAHGLSEWMQDRSVSTQKEIHAFAHRLYELELKDKIGSYFLS